jgi:hypothetical protein
MEPLPQGGAVGLLAGSSVTGTLASQASVMIPYDAPIVYGPD